MVLNYFIMQMISINIIMAEFCIRSNAEVKPIGLWAL